MNRCLATFSLSIALLAAAAVLCTAVLSTPVRAADAPAQQAPLPDGVVDNAGRKPDEIRNVAVDEYLGRQLPGDLMFTNEHGEEQPLSSYFHTGRPMVLQMGYFQCPHLCSEVSRGLLDAVKDVNLQAGKDFDMLFVSIDPGDTPSLAAMKRQNTVEYYGHMDQASGFHFMVGKPKSISLLADAAGFRYQEVTDSQQFAHPAVIFVLTPDGKLSRYMYGVKFDPQTLRLSLVEASAGKIGTAMDKFLLICLHYDSNSQHYKLAIYSMRLGGILTIFGLGGALSWLFYREFHTRAVRQAAVDAKSDSELSKNETE